MRAKKDPKTGKWYIRFRYTDWQGKRRETMKRGFETKREAEEWLRTFLAEQKADLNITFADFTEMYFKSISPRLRENTLRTKHYIIDLKIMPYFGLKKITEISPANIIAWENELLAKGVVCHAKRKKLTSKIQKNRQRTHHSGGYKVCLNGFIKPF